MATTATVKKGPVAVLKQTASEFSEDGCTTLAAALAYYTIFSLPPLLVLIVSIVGFFWEPQDIQQQLNEQVTAAVGADGAKQIQTMLEHANKPGHGLWGTIIGAVVLIIGATGVVGQLQTSLNTVWEVQADPKQSGFMNLVFKRILSFGMILGLAFVLLVSLALSALLTAAGDQVGSLLPAGTSGTMIYVLNFVLAYAVITIVFAAIFKFLPDAEVRWKDVLIGAAVTALLFAIGKFLLGMYLGSSDMGSTYGAAGSLALLLVWVYYSSMILLVGAEFTQVWAKRYGEQIQPSKGAVRVIQETKRVAAGDEPGRRAAS